MLDINLKIAVDKWSNSFLRPLIPPKLLSNSDVINTEDDGAKLIYLKFLYGIQNGRYSTRPTDGGIGNIITNLSEESLWLYSMKNESTPEGFKAQKKKESGTIGTGDIRKCSTCRGQGRVRCTTCGGKVRWTSKDFEGNRIENVCSCGDGKQMCGSCDGFGDVEVIILTQKEYKLFETKNSQYTGEVPKEKIKKITGDLIYEQVYEYPLDIIRKMLIGGIDADEFNQLNDAVLNYLKQSVDDQLKERGDIDTNKIHNQMDTLFNSLPNPGKENKVLEHEVMPIRVMVKIENAPVKQIDYEYKNKKYSLWVYGKENSVWTRKTPFSFNYKNIILTILFLGLIIIGSFYYIDSNHENIYNNNVINSTFNKKNIKKKNEGKLAVISDADGYTNLRKGKGTNFQIVKKIYSNEKFYVHPTNEKWWKVETKDGVNGYMFSNRINLLNDRFYIINVTATKTEKKALSEVKKLSDKGYKAGHLWIPNYKSLSGALLYSVYIGPFYSQTECEREVEKYRKINNNAYGILVSQESKRLEIRGLGKIKTTSNQNRGIIKGTNIVIRDSHSSKAKIIGSFKKSDESVKILESYISSDTSETLINSSITASLPGGKSYFLEIGKAVNILFIENNKVQIQFKNKELSNLTAIIDKKYIDTHTNSNWYKVQRKNGEIGWVFGKFIAII